MHPLHKLVPGSIVTKIEIEKLRKLDRENTSIRLRREAMNRLHFERQAIQARNDFREGDATESETEQLFKMLERLHSPAAGRAFDDLQLDLAMAALTRFNRDGRQIITLVLNRARNEIVEQLRIEVENDKLSTGGMAPFRSGPIPCSNHAVSLRKMAQAICAMRAEVEASSRPQFGGHMPPDVRGLLDLLGVSLDVEIDEFAGLSEAPDLPTLPDTQITASSLVPLDDAELAAILARRARQGEAFTDMPRAEMIARILKERSAGPQTDAQAAAKQALHEKLAALGQGDLNTVALEMGVFTDGLSREEIIENLLATELATALAA